jgi:glycosyltransferase involved in cell wall biosynthesis
MKSVSVIIPDYNQAHYLSNAITSVLRQSYPAHEIIVVDDGSTDESREVINQFGDNVRYIRQENQGLAGARNTGIQASAGELIGLLDADDEWAPDYLEAMLPLADEHPDVPVFYCMAHCMDMNGIDLPQFVGGPPVSPDWIYQVLLRQNFIIPSTVLFRRKPILEAGMFDASLRSCEDWDLWLRLLPSRKLVGSSRSLVRYRVHGSSLSTNVKGMHDATKKVIEKHFGSDEGDMSFWSAEKRRAYGGMYRYQTITFIQRQNNWEAALASFRIALEIDPSLASDLSFFYDLALGTQPVGYRDRGELPGFETNALQLENAVHVTIGAKELKPLRLRVLAMCYFALGLASYNLDKRARSRSYFLKAVLHHPGLIFDTRISGNFLKSFFPKQYIERLKKFKEITS